MPQGRVHSPYQSLRGVTVSGSTSCISTGIDLAFPYSVMRNEDLQKLDRRLKERICPICVERGPRSTCNLWELAECPITLHLPRLVEVVRSIHSGQMEDYLQKVRQEICTTCESALSPLGHCDVRNSGHCALDAYLLLIVQIIDDFLAEKAQAQSA